MYKTYCFAMSGQAKNHQIDGKNYVIPDIALSQIITQTCVIDILTHPGTTVMVDDMPQVYGQVVQPFDVVVYTDPTNNRCMSMLYTGSIFIGYFSLPIEGVDEWSQSLLTYLLSNGFVVVEIPTAFEGVIS